MTVIQGLGTSWNLPNYVGELFTADMQQTPLLSMIGGMTGGMRTTNWEFPTAQLFDYPEPKQPNISERASAIAPPPAHIQRRQEKNVVQIHQKTIDLTYHKLATTGRMSGIATANTQLSPQDELAWQITHAQIVTTARDVEHSFIQGTYQESTGDDVANRTRGMLQLTEQGITIPAAGADLTIELLKTLYREMANSGAYFDNMVMFLPAYLKQKISDIYSNQSGFGLPPTRNVGGIDINQIQTDFFALGVVWNRFMPEDTILLADVAHMAPVFLEVPGKGVFFVEELPKTGANERRQLYGEIGLAHGPAFLHGAITGLKHE